MIEPINEVLLPSFCLNIVAMLCATVNVTVGGQTVDAVYLCEPFTFGTDTINLIDFSPSSLRKLFAASLTHAFLQF